MQRSYIHMVLFIMWVQIVILGSILTQLTDFIWKTVFGFFRVPPVPLKIIQAIGTSRYQPFFPAWLSLFHFIQTTLNASSTNKIAHSRDMQSEAGERGDLGPRLENSCRSNVTPMGSLYFLNTGCSAILTYLGMKCMLSRGSLPGSKEKSSHNTILFLCTSVCRYEDDKTEVPTASHNLGNI